MRLSNAQIAAVKEQTGADPIPEEHPNLSDLREAFGDHTFYLDQTGLHVLEDASGGEPANENEAAPEPNGADKTQLAIIRVASWTDDERTTLGTHEPQVADQVLTVDAEPGDQAN